MNELEKRQSDRQAAATKAAATRHTNRVAKFSDELKRIIAVNTHVVTVTHYAEFRQFREGGIHHHAGLTLKTGSLEWGANFDFNDKSVSVSCWKIAHDKTFTGLYGAAVMALIFHVTKFIMLSDDEKSRVLKDGTPLTKLPAPSPVKFSPAAPAPAAKTTARVIEFYIPKNYRPKSKAGSTDGGEIEA